MMPFSINEQEKIIKIMDHRNAEMVIKVYSKYIDDAGGMVRGGMNLCDQLTLFIYAQKC